MERDIEVSSEFHRAQHQDLGPGGGQLEHLLEGDLLEFSGLRDDPGVGGEDSIDVGVDFTSVGPVGGSQSDGRGIRSAPAEGGDVL